MALRFFAKLTFEIFQKDALASGEVAMATSTTPEVTIIEQAPTEIVVASAPSIEKKSDAEEVIIVRLDIDPVEEVKPTFTKQKRRKSLFGKIVGEIRQALDGEPVNWQKLKEGNPALENNIHNVANTYIKTEENLGVEFAKTVKGYKRHYAVAINRDNVEVIKSEYSFTQDPQVLVDQLKLIIDQKNLQG